MPRRSKPRPQKRKRKPPRHSPPSAKRSRHLVRRSAARLSRASDRIHGMEAVLSQSNPAKRSLILGAATNWAAFFATLSVAFFLAPYLIRSLGDARYGVWCVVEAILAYFT